MIYLGVRHLGRRMKPKVNNQLAKVGSSCEIHWVSLSHYDNLAKYYFCFRIFRLSKIEITYFTAIVLVMNH